jgi:hypothetical protein
LFTSGASLLFALINPSAPYWAFGFPAAIFSVVGADFVFAAGSIFVAKVALPHEQSLAGGVFQTMGQVNNPSATKIIFLPMLTTNGSFLAWNCSGRNGDDDRL